MHIKNTSKDCDRRDDNNNMNNRYVTLQAAGKLKVTDKGILSSLLRLASDDNSWKVKAHTIKGEYYEPLNQGPELLFTSTSACKLR